MILSTYPHHVPRFTHDSSYWFVGCLFHFFYLTYSYPSSVLNYYCQLSVTVSPSSGHSFSHQETTPFALQLQPVVYIIVRAHVTCYYNNVCSGRSSWLIKWESMMSNSSLFSPHTYHPACHTADTHQKFGEDSKSQPNIRLEGNCEEVEKA